MTASVRTSSGRARGRYLSPVHDHDTVGILRGQIGIVQHGDNAPALAGDCARGGQAGMLMGQVKGIGRLVEQKIAGSVHVPRLAIRHPDLCQYTGQMDALTLTPGQGGIDAIGQMHDLRLPHRGLDGAFIFSMCAASPMRATAQMHDLPHPKRKAEDRRLGQDRRRRASSSRGRRASGTPSRAAMPWSGLRAPERTCSRVDLPAPFGPMTARTSPGCTASATPRNTSVPPRATLTSRSSSITTSPVHDDA